MIPNDYEGDNPQGYTAPPEQQTGDEPNPGLGGPADTNPTTSLNTTVFGKGKSFGFMLIVGLLVIVGITAIYQIVTTGKVKIPS